MKRIKRLLIGFVLFIPLSAILTLGVFSAAVEFSQPWGFRSAPPRDESPRSLLERIPSIVVEVALAFGAFVVADVVGRWVLGSDSKEEMRAEKADLSVDNKIPIDEAPGP
jgi:hypothetical protein